MSTAAPARQLTVYVYDDEEGSARSTKERLEAVGGLQVLLLPNDHDAIGGLEERRRSARSGAAAVASNLLDEADILIVDYDLTFDATDPMAAAETGERVAYLARCYSRCKTIVALNQFSSRPTFDLTLKGHLASYADLNISADEVDNPGLWGREHDGYLPWSWPDLTALPDAHQERARLAQAGLQDPVLEVLGLADPAVANALTRAQLSSLTPRPDPHRVSVADAVRGGRLGLRPKDQPWSDDALANIAAARLSKWLERAVLPGQDVLVDAPHLVSRYPSLLADRTAAAARSGAAVQAVGPEAEPHLHPAPAWLSRQAWLWPGLAQDSSVAEVADPFSQVKEGDPFVEDSSTFRSPEQVRAFLAEVEPFSRRHATRAASDDERAASPYSGRHGLSAVTYQPAVLFALA